jgi:hypothetical protein
VPVWVAVARLGWSWLGAGWLRWIRMGVGRPDKAWPGCAPPGPGRLGREWCVPCGLLAWGGLTLISHAVEATESSPAISTTPMISARRSGRLLPGSQGSSDEASGVGSASIRTRLNGSASSDLPVG